MMDIISSDSDWDSFSESGSSSEDHDSELMFGGKACNIFSSLEESIGKIDDFLSFERGFMHGDIVCSVTDPSGQMGIVTAVKMLANVEDVYGNVVKNINCNKLQKIRSFSVGDHVVCGPWLGRVDKVIDCLKILFNDGEKCEVTEMDQATLLPVSPNLFGDSQYPYYPGQRVRVRHSTVSKSVRWFCGTGKENQDEGTISSVEAGLIYVDWLACALLEPDLSLPTPTRHQDAKNLTLLSCFCHANWQLGDWCVIPNSERCGGIKEMVHSASTFQPSMGHENVDQGFKQRESGSNIDSVFAIVKTKTILDVLWQDGSCSSEVDSQSLIPINVINAHEFWPGQFVLEKSTCDDLPHDTSSQKYGVVKGVDAKERTVKVNWYSFTFDEGNDPNGVLMEETVSAYELLEHPNYSYSLGDVVFRSVQGKFVCEGDKESGHVNMDCAMDLEIAHMSKKSDRDYGGFLDSCYLSSIGNVIGFKDGNVEVKWASGLSTKVAPYEIVSMDKYKGSTTTTMFTEEIDEDVNEQNGQSALEKGQDLFDYNHVGEDCKKYACEDSSLSFPRAALGFLTSIASSLFGSLSSSSVSGQKSSGDIPDVGNKSETHCENEVLELCSLSHERQPIAECDLQASSKTSLRQHIKEVEQNENLPIFLNDKNPELFRQFDMVSDCLDHHFIDVAGRGSPTSQVKLEWLKRVQHEWSILEKNLPETIYVRVFEERMDLLRAAIIGAPGTPYHDGLFIFDIFLPSDYPNEPPLVHYHSGGLRVNPNLYESGKVCLSLLNTWAGTGTEVWNSKSSTILQVLLSLQALVLNAKPYFNEAGFDKQMGRAEGEKNSVSYNENAFLVTRKSMLYLIRKPPKHFEALVEEHFSRRSQHILTTCQAYLEGTPAGCVLEYGATEQENHKGSSTGFKIMLAKLFPKLVEEFSDKGIACSQFISQNK